MERFHPEELTAHKITPEELAEVTQRFAERQALSLREAEEAESDPTVAEVAKILGTDENDVRKLLQELKQAEASRVAAARVARSRRLTPHLLFLPVIALWMTGLVLHHKAMSEAFATRSAWDVMRADLGPDQSISDNDLFDTPSRLLGPSAGQAPPQGYLVSVWSRGELLTKVGNQGAVVGGEAARNQLRQSIIDLLRYEEGLPHKGVPQLPIDFAREPLSAGWTVGNTSCGLRQIQPGFHLVKMHVGDREMRFFLPDGRWALGNKAAYQADLNRRLDFLLDAKAIPDVLPSQVQKCSKRVEVPLDLPPGTSISMDDGTTAVWAHGPANWNSDGLFAKERLEKQVEQFEEAVRKRGTFSARSSVTLETVFPFGAGTYENYPPYEKNDLDSVAEHTRRRGIIADEFSRPVYTPRNFDLFHPSP